jgi:molecular chaperone GrpE (heat shock protein)
MAAKTKRNIWTLWEKYKKASTGSLNECIDKNFSICSETVCAQISADAVSFSRLGDSDEAIYSHLVGLMGVYRRVIALADAHSFDSKTVTALVAGICEVLNSRLREFEDEKFEGDNPITLEKTAIINETLKKSVSAIEELRKNFAVGLCDVDLQEWDESFDIILRGNFYEMYSVYREGLRSCLSGIDDLHSRKTARFFTQLIEREWEELGNIIKVQVVALEDAGKDSQTPVIPSILDALREAYQQMGPVIEKLQRPEPPKKPMPLRALENFESELLAALENSCSQLPGRKNFYAALDVETMILLDAIDYKKAAYGFQRVVSAKVLLAEEVTDVFEKISLLKNFEELPDAEREILSGISETIQIKISGLRESIQSFAKQGGDIIKNFSAEKNNSSDYESVIKDVRAAWLKNPPQDEASIPAFFEGCAEIFAPFRERAEKQISLYTQFLEKATFRFKKEVLLYEICTFEEILTHSVPRLRGSRNDAVLTAALMLERTFGALEVILKKSNIEVIRPALKEQFNAKEHEILVAEKHDGFEKGEIIKIVTAGYRHKEQVILRANIIAAR